MMMNRLYWKVMRGLSFDRPSPIVKQAPLAITYFVAVVLVVSVPGLDITNAPLAILGNAFVVVATAMAVVITWARRLDRLIPLIPMIDIIAMGAFRGGTGADVSLFSVLIVLPVIWLASFSGRRYIAYTTVFTAFALMLPVMVGVAAPNDAADWVRGVFVPAVFGVIATIVNELSRQNGVQVRSIARLARTKDEMLQRSIAFAERLQESEARAREAAREFKEVWDAVTEQAVVSTDVTGLVELWNPGATLMLGWRSDETEGVKHITELHLPEELEQRAKELDFPPGAAVLMPGFAALVESARLGKADNREWTYVRADGEHVPVQLSVTQRTDQDGNVTGFLFVASNVSKAREVARLKDEFIGLISHELRTPLSSILGYLELLRDEDDVLAPVQNQYLDVVERNAHRLLRLVGDLLLTAQLDSGQFRIETRPVRVEQIVRASVETARPLAEAAGVSIATELPEESVIVLGDSVRLGQAVDNLLSNAIKFTPRAGSVTVGVAVSGDRAVVTLADTGFGIPEAELSELFGRFFRASTATRNAVPGVGLGLAITRAIVTAHGGEIEVSSEVGVGTTFSMTLPLDRSGEPTSTIPVVNSV